MYNKIGIEIHIKIMICRSIPVKISPVLISLLRCILRVRKEVVVEIQLEATGWETASFCPLLIPKVGCYSYISNVILFISFFNLEEIIHTRLGLILSNNNLLLWLCEFLRLLNKSSVRCLENKLLHAVLVLHLLYSLYSLYTILH